MNRRSFAILVGATMTLGLSGCATIRLNRLDGDLKAALAGEPVVVTEGDGFITLTSSADRMYPSGAWQLPPDVPVLNRIATILAGLQNTAIVVSGYTDTTPIGPGLRQMGISSNKELSYNRAVAVVDYLAARGVKRSLLSAQGFGEANPVASNDTPDGRARNRRVEITLRGDGS